MMRVTEAGLKSVAVFEALKGSVVLLAAAGLVSLVHENAQAVAEEIVRQFHLNPASRYPRIFLDAMQSLNSSRLWLLAGGALLYALMRFVEAFGLWRGRNWAEWFGIVSGGVYLPIEIYELLLGVTVVKVVLFATNVLIVGFLGWTLYKTRQQLHQSGQRGAPLPQS